MKDWIKFTEVGPSKSGLTKIWNVLPTEMGFELGQIKWWAPWRRYVFCPAGDAIFDKDCLCKIATFCENATYVHNQKREHGTSKAN